MVQQVRTWYDKLGLWGPFITMAVGYGISWGSHAIAYANKIDLLTQQVATQNVEIDQMSRKLDQHQQEDGKTDNRVTALEVKVFGRQQLR